MTIMGCFNGYDGYLYVNTGGPGGPPNRWGIAVQSWQAAPLIHATPVRVMGKRTTRRVTGAGDWRASITCAIDGAFVASDFSVGQEVECAFGLQAASPSNFLFTGAGVVRGCEVDNPMDGPATATFIVEAHDSELIYTP